MLFIAICGIVAVLVVVYSVIQQPRKPFVIGLLIGGGLGFIAPILGAVWAVSKNGSEGAMVAMYAPIFAAIGALAGVLIATFVTPPRSRQIGAVIGIVFGLAATPFVMLAFPYGGYDETPWVASLCVLAGAVPAAWAGASYERLERPLQVRGLILVFGLLAVMCLMIAANVDGIRYRSPGVTAFTGTGQTDALLWRLKNGSTSQRCQAAGGLAYEHPSPSVISALFEAMGSEPDPCSRMAIADSISKINDPTIEPTAAGMLVSGNGGQRHMAAEILARTRDPRGRQALTQALSSPDPSAREAAQCALRNNGGYGR